LTVLTMFLSTQRYVYSVSLLKSTSRNENACVWRVTCSTRALSRPKLPLCPPQEKLCKYCHEVACPFEVLTGQYQGTPCCRECTGCRPHRPPPRPFPRRLSPNAGTLKQKQHSVNSLNPLAHFESHETSSS
jgi:hypothetical protein